MRAVYERHEKYEELFAYPTVEIKPAYHSFAFSNPTIRIVDIGPQAATSGTPVETVESSRGSP